MNKRQVEHFFEILSKIYAKPCRVVLTGAAAGILYGRVRATLDIDFEALTENWDEFSKAVEQVRIQTGIEAQFSEDIDHWSSITLSGYREHVYLHQKFGSLEIFLMEPPYWAIGKLSRYLDQDIEDMMLVFKKTLTPWENVLSVAGTALKKSPKSTDCFLFRKQTEDFIKNRGREVWGDAFDPQKAIAFFHQHAGIASA